MSSHIDDSYRGPTAVFTDASLSGGLSDFSAIIDWGDGAKTKAKVLGGPGTHPYEVKGHHAYSSPGAFSVTTITKDAGGSIQSASCTVLVRDDGDSGVDEGNADGGEAD